MNMNNFERMTNNTKKAANNYNQQSDLSVDRKNLHKVMQKGRRLARVNKSLAKSL